MSGGEALDLALGLLRAPARRGALAARPLPTGMTTLLEVAGGSEAAARAAAASTGATPAELLEASRFFVQQILFIEDAGAYRVLGAGPDAPQSTLQAHHRHLQRWLHPDRDGGEAWDSAFSARVNDAWNQLRTPKARRAYDQSRLEPGQAGGTAQADGTAVAASGSGWRPPATIPVAEAAHTRPHTLRRYAGPLAVLALGLACIWLLWIEQQRTAPPTSPDQPASTAPPAPPVGRPYAADASDVEIGDERGDPSFAGRRGRSPDLLAVAPVPMPATAPVPVPATVPATAPVPVPPPATSVISANPPTPTPTAASASANPAPPPVGRPYAADASDVEIGGERGDPIFAGRRGRSPDLRAPSSAIATTLTPEPTPEPDPLLLFQQAQHTAAQATAYLASDGSHIPPIWNDFPTEAAAADARARLSVRLDGRAARDISLGSPQWRMDGKRAVLDAGYRIGGWRTRESGVLRIEMSRRQQRWLITHLALEPSA